jgi:hypothetical protein
MSEERTNGNNLHCLVGAPTHYPAEACAAWTLKWDNPFPAWKLPSLGLEPYSAFVRGWGFRMYCGFGWELIDPALCTNTTGERPETRSEDA